jgi:hypothetical protein
MDLGEHGRTASEVVAFLRESGAQRVVVVAAHSDRRGSEALLDAGARIGFPTASSADVSAWKALPHASPEIRSPGSPWAVRYGLDRPEGVERLIHRAPIEFPSLLPWIFAVVNFAKIGVHPLAEVFAGNGILERNADYLENLQA